MNRNLSSRLSIFYPIVFLLSQIYAGWLAGDGQWTNAYILWSFGVLMCLIKESLDLIGENLNEIQ